MTQDFMEYPKLVEQAMRSVVRSALEVVVEHGLPGLHHFYITFRTQDPGVGISDRLLAQYPEEMTIVLEHQFWDLQVDETGFSISLSFGGVRENLSIPYSTISAFVDPSVKFGLQFDAPNSEETGSTSDLPETTPESDDATDTTADIENRTAEPGDAEIVALDSFRKK
jgi:hypothetical protein